MMTILRTYTGALPVRARQSFILILTLCLSLFVKASDNWQLYLEKPVTKMLVGEPVDFQLISLAPPESGLQLQIPATSDFSVIRGQPAVFEKNGRSGIRYPVRFTALKQGTLNIPALSLVGHHQKSTEPSTISAEFPPISDEMELEVHRSKDEIYLGQSVRLYFEWTTSIPLQAINAVNIRIPEMEHPDMTAMPPWNQFQADTKRSIGLPLGGQRVIARWHPIADGRIRIHFSYVVKPEKTGTFELPAPMLLASIDREMMGLPLSPFSGMPYPAHFDNNFFDQGGDSSGYFQRLMTVAKPMKLRVKALPAGQPENFSGIIGRPEVAVQLEPAEATQGEPIQLSFEVLHTDIEFFQIPDLQKLPAFTRWFDVPDGKNSFSYNEGAKTIRQTLFTRDAGVSTIPEVIINYFDPQAGLYRDFVTKPLPIKVNPAEQFNLANTVQSDKVNLRNPIREDKSGIWEHVWNAELVKDTGQEKKAWPGVTLLLLFPPLLLLFSQRGDIKQALNNRRFRTALAQFERHLNESCDPFVALGSYLQKQAGLPPSRLNEEGLRDALSDLSVQPETLKSLIQWVETYQLTFTQSDACQYDSESLVRLVKQLDKELPVRKINEGEQS